MKKTFIFLAIISIFNISYAQINIKKYKEISIFTSDNLQPLVILENEKIGGLFGEIFIQATKEYVSNYKINNYPWPRTQNELKKTANSVIFPFARNEEREKYYKWIDKIFDDHVCIYTAKPNKKINSLQEIENINSLGFLRNGPETEFISKISTKVQKIDSANVNDLMLKLFKKEIDAVVGGSYLKYVWKKNNLKEENLFCGKTKLKHELYIAASIKSSEEFVEELKIIIQKFKKTKKYKEILEKYQYLWKESY
ncbi:substrate-binding periplasmic protein [Pigmentibacter ruber]|uniref:substrate-binding periplasmic protein n=1 Tax=Pigmentibacter ruber TaxID=2683196 RepID=UPI00131E8AA2|nr:transporter substrate-binding domain-containing protein [Pigmentibacter ruber]BFD33350.1 transporter substrate-binding domain-containing protein [Pigmentibacter ruber]